MKNNVIPVVIIGMILANLILLSSVFSAKAQVQPEIYFDPASYTGTQVGETFNVTVKVLNLDPAQEVVGIQFRVLYDPNLLEAVNVAEGPFLQQFPNSAAPPYTYFINYTEQDPTFGQNVLIGILLVPNSTGSWTNFPFGSGALATITFKAINQAAEPQPPASSALTLVDTELMNDTLDYNPHSLQNGSYQMKALSFNYQPTEPISGQPVLFEAPTASYPVTYHWSFGDGTSLDTTVPSTNHIYASLGTYSVTLACTADSLTSTVSETITVLSPQPTIDVKADAGSMYFKGETAEFSVLVTNYGESINATGIKALLYHGNALLVDLTNATQSIATGLYRIQYTVPADADTGAYTLLVEAEYYNAKGADIRTFQISQNTTAMITAIQDNIATINTTLATLQTSLQNINATLADISKKVDTINGNTASLGNIQTTLYIVLALLVIALILVAAILIFARKK